MLRVLFHIGNLPVYSYGVLIVIAFATAVFWARYRAPKWGLQPNQVSDIAYWTLFTGIAGARLLFILQDLPYYLAQDHWKEIFGKFEGLTSFGGIIGGGIGLLIGCKRAKIAVWPMLDVVSAPFLVAHAIGRFGCLLNGCCYGGHCDLPWGIHVEGQDGLFHPAQIYDSFFNLAAVGLLLLFERKTRSWGASFGLMLILHGLSRFIYEFWRAGTTSTYMGSLPITDAQAMALAVCILGAIVLAFVNRRSREGLPA